MAVVQGSPVCLGLVVGVGHVLKQEIQKGVLALISKLAVGVTPFAVIFVERTVGFTADHRVVGQRHTAALTVEGLGRAQKCVDRYAEFAGQDLEQFRVGLGHPGLPSADGLPGHIDAFCHLFLRQVVLFAQVP